MCCCGRLIALNPVVFLQEKEAEVYYSFYISAIGDLPGGGMASDRFCYPNPASAQITVMNPYQKEAHLKIFGMTGALIKETGLNKGENTVSVQNLPKGIYLFRLQSGNSVIQNKVMVY